ncbi:MAG: flagellar biosynthesis protein FlhB [FCB group bacterium]|nr:flagellar biosynthesis protein FlhB [FCB group bacterium]
MADHSAQDKTEAPTPRRKEEALEKGEVAKSMELNSVAVMLAGIISVQFISGSLMKLFSDFTISTYLNSGTFNMTVESFPQQFRGMLLKFTAVLAPVFIILLITGIGANVAQTGFFIAKKALEPKFEKINPAKGFKRILSVRSLVEALKGILKILIVSLIAFLVLKKYIADFWALYSASAAEIFSLIGIVLKDLGIKIGVVLAFLAVADFAYQKYEHQKSLKMTKQEVRDEAKQYEGNQEMKGHIRAMQKQLARTRMMAAVPDATVVVTNPTYIAIAIKYDPSSGSDAPIIVAKGKRKIAQRIKEIARENEVPVIENKPLARTLYEITDVGMQVPVILYQAVAELLAQVYRMQSENKKITMGLSHA